MKKHHRLGWVTMLVAVGAFLVALPAQATAAPTTGYLRIGHFVPGVGVAQVDLDGRVLVGALSYQQVTSYVAVPAGSHTLEVTTSASGGTAAHQLSATETVGAGQSVTVLIVASPSGAMRASSFVDNLSEPPPGDAKVRVIDTLATVPGLGGNLTMVMDPPPSRPMLVPATVEGQASPYVDVPAAAYNVAFTNSSTGATVLSGKDWPVSAGTVASLVVLQGSAAPTLEVLKDAVGAASLPAGGMQTGAGGMALRAHRGSFGGLEVGLGVVIAVLLGGIILVRRTRTSLGLAAVACATGMVASSCGSESSVRAAPVPVATVGRTAWSPPSTAASRPASAAPSLSLTAAGTADPTNQPERIAAPAVGIDAPIVNLGRLADGTMQVPSDFGVAGWYDQGPPPGEPGPAVILGHVDSTTGPAVFWRLSDLRPGDQVIITSAHGTETFAVTRIQSAAKDAFPTAEVFGPVADPELRLITCSGAFDRATGHYLDNTIVFASLITG